MARYLSGRSKKRSQSQLKEDRYRYLAVDQAEPNLGDPSEFDTEASIPPGTQYQVISVLDRPGERYWIPRGGGLIPGALTIFDENVIIPNNSGVSSITQLNFKGNAIKAEGFVNPDGSPGATATITVFSPGSEGQFIINDNNEFTGVSSIFYDTNTNYIGIGITTPTQPLDVNGDIRLRKTIYDWDNQPGVQGDLLVKNSDGGLNWTKPDSVITAAGGQIGQIQFHANTGLVDGADIFYYDDLNDRIGIGSTQPKYLLDVLGISSFKGTTYIDNLNGTNLSTLNKLTVNGETILKNSVDAEIGASLNDVRIGISSINEIDTSTGNLILDSSGGTVVVDDNLFISGITSVGFITAKNGYFSGILTAINLDFTNTLIQYLNVTGIATINTAKIDKLDVGSIGTAKDFNISNYLDVSGNANFQKQLSANNLNVSGISTLGNIKLSANTITANVGNLILDSTSGNVVSSELIRFDNTTESSDTSTGSVVISGGLAVKKNTNINGNVNIAGATKLSTNGGITTTGGDLYVNGDLYVLDDVFHDEFTANRGEIKEYLKTKNFQATGISTLSALGVSGNSTFAGNITVDSNTFLNGDVDLGDTNTDTITFTGRVDSDVLPSTDNARDLGSSALKWNQVYATEFIGQLTGNANTASKLASERNIAITGDLAWNVNFDGSTNVTATGTLANSGVTQGSYGSATIVPVFNVDAKGRVTSVTDTGIDFATATVANSNAVASVSRSTNASHYLTFVDSNNSTASYENLYTDDGITYNPSTNALTVSGNAIFNSDLTVVGIASLGGDVDLGNSNTDTVTFTGRVDSDVLPSTDNARDLGSSALKWNQVYATEFSGQLTGNADTATKLATKRNIAVTGDLAWNVDFDGSANVTATGTLANSGVTQGSYGSATIVPVFNVDAKGRVTSVTDTGIDFATATVANANAIASVARDTNASHYLTFVDSNNSTASYENLYTDSDISYNPSTNLLTTQNITVSGNAVLNGDVDLGNTNADTVTFTGRVDSNVLPSTDNARDLGSSALKWNNVYAKNFEGKFIGNADTATNLAGGLTGSLPYQTSQNTTAFLAEPNADGSVLTYNNTSNVPQWSNLSDLPGAGYTLDAIDSDNNVILRLSDGNTNDDVTITAGSNITINPVAAGGFTINSASLGDLGGISGIEIRDSGVVQGSNVTKLNFTNDISATVSGGIATISATIPTKTSDITNDSGFITSSSLPTKTSQLTNDSGFITSSSLPTKTSDLTNDSGFITSSSLPTKTSQLTNDSGFITSSSLPTKTSDLTNDSGFITSSSLPTKTSQLTNDSGFITSASVGDGTLTLAAGTGVTLSANPTFTANQSANKTITINADFGAIGVISVTTTSANKTLSNLEFCTVLSDNLDLTLPSSPSAGNKVIIGMGLAGKNITVISGDNIMGSSEDFIIDIPYVTVTFTYINSSLGWTFS